MPRQKRTPQEIAAAAEKSALHHAAQAEKSRFRQARALDPLIDDAMHLRDDLRAWLDRLSNPEDRGNLELAVDAMESEIKVRAARAGSDASS